ncbi:MAG: hypothetical protein WCQ55_04915 [Paludibacteraceae bacterium]
MRGFLVLIMLFLSAFAANSGTGGCRDICKCPCGHPECEPCRRCAFRHHHECTCRCHDNGCCIIGDIDNYYARGFCEECSEYHERLRSLQWYDPLTGKLDPPLYDAPRPKKKTPPPSKTPKTN